MKTITGMLRLFNVCLLSFFISSCFYPKEKLSMSNDGSYKLALDQSLTKFRLGFPCKYLAVSSNSTGQALGFVDSNWNMPILLYPGYSGLINAKESIYVDVGPQPGKILEMFYGDNPIISSSIDRAAVDTSLGTLTSYKLRNVSGSDYLIHAIDNVRGIKILSGTIYVTVGANPAVDKARINLQFFDPLAVQNSFLSALSYISNGQIFEDSKNIYPFLIPPNLDVLFSSIINGNATTSYAVNYQIL